MTGQSPVYVCTVLRARGASHLYALQLELQLALRLVDVEGGIPLSVDPSWRGTYRVLGVLLPRTNKTSMLVRLLL